MTTSDWIQTIASVVTAVGVAIAAWQLYHTKQQSQSQFEDSFAEQYRRVAAKLPLEALLGRELGDEEVKAHLRAFYEYFDLSNEQAFIAKQGRLRPETWANWSEGIEQHMSRPGFKQAWTTLLPDLDGSFDDFKALLPPSLRNVSTQETTEDSAVQHRQAVDAQV